MVLFRFMKSKHQEPDEEISSTYYKPRQAPPYPKSLRPQAVVQPQRLGPARTFEPGERPPTSSADAYLWWLQEQEREENARRYEEQRIEVERKQRAAYEQAQGLRQGPDNAPYPYPGDQIRFRDEMRRQEEERQRQLKKREEQRRIQEQERQAIRLLEEQERELQARKLTQQKQGQERLQKNSEHSMKTRKDALLPKIRHLRSLMREKYKLDLEIWSRGVSIDLPERSYAILREIQDIVGPWQKDLFDPEDWKVARKIKAGLLGDQVSWSNIVSNPPEKIVISAEITKISDNECDDTQEDQHAILEDMHKLLTLSSPPAGGESGLFELPVETQTLELPADQPDAVQSSKTDADILTSNSPGHGWTGAQTFELAGDQANDVPTSKMNSDITTSDISDHGSTGADEEAARVDTESVSMKERVKIETHAVRLRNVSNPGQHDTAADKEGAAALVFSPDERDLGFEVVHDLNKADSQRTGSRQISPRRNIKTVKIEPTFSLLKLWGVLLTFTYGLLWNQQISELRWHWCAFGMVTIVSAALATPLAKVLHGFLCNLSLINPEELSGILHPRFDQCEYEGEGDQVEVLVRNTRSVPPRWRKVPGQFSSSTTVIGPLLDALEANVQLIESGPQGANVSTPADGSVTPDGQPSPTLTDERLAVWNPETLLSKQVSADDGMMKHQPTEVVDYLSHDWREEDLWASWRHIVSEQARDRRSLRLENASWRAWAKLKCQLAVASPESIDWAKDYDPAWLHGPLITGLKYDATSELEASHIVTDDSYSTQKWRAGMEPVINATSPALKKPDPVPAMFARPLAATASMLRPRLKLGHRRLEWTCSCGRNMYGDYKAEDANSLEQKLKRIANGLSVQTEHVNDAARPEVPPDGPPSQPGKKDSTPPYQSSSRGGSSNGHSRNSSGSSSDQGEDLSNSESDLSQTSSVTSISQSSSECDPVKSFLGICVNRGRYLVSLGEIALVSKEGKRKFRSDFELFAAIRQRYNEMRRRHLYGMLYRPNQVEFVHFAFRHGVNQLGIYDRPSSIPPKDEVLRGRYHYYECPMETMPPMDTGTFFHYFWDHARHGPSNDLTFYDRLPKKLGFPILMEKGSSALSTGWGIHIIEGPNIPILLWIATAVVALSFIVSLTYDIVLHDKDSGFAIGQWMLAVLSVGTAAGVVHVADLA